MAKARSLLTDRTPKLVFRENGSPRKSGAVSYKESDVELNWVTVNKSESYKTVFLGDSNVGKTCLAKLYVEGQVVQQTTNTIGFDHHVKEVEPEEGMAVKLQIWDTAGMEQFRNALITKYYRNADGIVLVYDITRKETFENLVSWIKEVEQYCTGGLERIRMILIGNKLDLQAQRKVSMEEVQSLMRRYKVSNWIELSAKNLAHLSKLEGVFMALAKQMSSVRQQIEMTKSAKLAQQSVITLADDWEVITAPEDPVPRYAYVPQDEKLRRSRAQNCRC